MEAWNKALTEGAGGVFGSGKEQKAKNDTALVARLYREIGQLKVKRDFLSEEVRSMRLAKRREMMDREHPSLSIVRQCNHPGSEQVRPVLPAQRSLGSGSGPDAGHGLAVSGDPFLRVAAHEDLIGATGDGGKPEAGAAADASPARDSWHGWARGPSSRTESLRRPGGETLARLHNWVLSRG